MPRTQTHADTSGRLVALLVFLLGVGMLVFVFVTALHLFQSPVPGLALPVAPGATAQPAANIGTALIVFLRELLLLGVMTLAGSILASKGAHLYFNTAHPPERSQEKSATSGKWSDAGVSKTDTPANAIEGEKNT